MNNHFLSQFSPFYQKSAISPYLAKQTSQKSIYQAQEYNNGLVSAPWSGIKNEYLLINIQKNSRSPSKNQLQTSNFRSPTQSKTTMNLRQTPRRSLERANDFMGDQGLVSRENQHRGSQQEGFRSKKFLDFNSSAVNQMNENISPNLPTYPFEQSNMLIESNTNCAYQENHQTPSKNTRSMSKKTLFNHQLGSQENRFGGNSPTIKPFTTGIDHLQDGKHRIMKKQGSTGTDSEPYSEDTSLISPIHFQKMRSVRGYGGLQGYASQAFFKSGQLNDNESFLTNNSKQEFQTPMSISHQNFQYNSPAPKHFSYEIFETPSYYVADPYYMSQVQIYPEHQNQVQSQSSNQLTQIKSKQNNKQLIRLSKCKISSHKRQKINQDKKQVKQSPVKSLNKRLLKSEQKSQTLFEKLIGKKADPYVTPKPVASSLAKKEKSPQQLKIVKAITQSAVKKIAPSSPAAKVQPTQVQSQLSQLSLANSGTASDSTSSTAAPKKCTCSKSKCLKLYCECFANGQVCGIDCGCKDCCNSEENTDLIEKAKEDIMKRDPKAFENKITKDVIGMRLQHRKGCTCKKSGCLKGYCECFQLGVPCTEWCKCTGCSNCEKKTQDSNEHHHHHVSEKAPCNSLKQEEQNKVKEEEPKSKRTKANKK